MYLPIKEREQLLTRVKEDLDKISSIFVDSGDPFDGKVSFLSAGKDHVHLHVELSPDLAPDEIVRKTARFSEVSIKSEFPELLKRN